MGRDRQRAGYSTLSADSLPRPCGQESSNAISDRSFVSFGTECENDDELIEFCVDRVCFFSIKITRSAIN